MDIYSQLGVTEVSQYYGPVTGRLHQVEVDVPSRCERLLGLLGLLAVLPLSSKVRVLYLGRPLRERISYVYTHM